jgi:hypothetical protein
LWACLEAWFAAGVLQQVSYTTTRAGAVRIATAAALLFFIATAAALLFAACRLLLLLNLFALATAAAFATKAGLAREFNTTSTAAFQFDLEAVANASRPATGW